MSRRAAALAAILVTGVRSAQARSFRAGLAHQFRPSGTSTPPRTYSRPDGPRVETPAEGLSVFPPSGKRAPVKQEPTEETRKGSAGIPVVHGREDVKLTIGAPSVADADMLADPTPPASADVAATGISEWSLRKLVRDGHLAARYMVAERDCAANRGIA